MPSGGVDAQAAAVRRLLADPDGARGLAARARERVLATFTTRHLAARLDVLLRAAV